MQQGSLCAERERQPPAVEVVVTMLEVVVVVVVVVVVLMMMIMMMMIIIITILIIQLMIMLRTTTANYPAPQPRHTDAEQLLQVREKIAVKRLSLGRAGCCCDFGAAGRLRPPAAQEGGQAAAEQADEDGATHDEVGAAELGHGVGGALMGEMGGRYEQRGCRRFFGQGVEWRWQQQAAAACTSSSMSSSSINHEQQQAAASSSKQQQAAGVQCNTSSRLRLACTRGLHTALA